MPLEIEKSNILKLTTSHISKEKPIPSITKDGGPEDESEQCGSKKAFIGVYLRVVLLENLITILQINIQGVWFT